MSTVVAKKDPNQLARQTIKDYLGKCKSQLQSAMPQGFGSPDKVVQSVMIACHMNPDLYKCDPMTIGACMIQSTMLRLTIGGPLGHAYMVPYYDKDFYGKGSGGYVATFQTGYKGYIQLAHNSGMIKAFFAHTRYENDQFSMELGTDPKVIHVPANGDRGKPIGYYSVIKTINGGNDFEYMSHEQILKHKEQHVKANSFAWKTSFDEMARKTLIRRIAKRCPVATELQTAAILDEYGEVGQPQQLTHLVEGIETPSRVGQMTARLNGESEVNLDQRIMESLKEAGTDWDRFWKENGGKILGNDSGIVMSLGELTDEDKQVVLGLLQ